jgi:hypothetical protein
MTTGEEDGDKTVGALAVAVAALERKVADAKRTSRAAIEQADKVNAFAGDMRALRDQLADIPEDIEERLDRLGAQIASLALGDSAESVGSWFDVGGPRWPRRRCGSSASGSPPLPGVPAAGVCWMHHPELVEQLLVLRSLWLWAYRNADSKLDWAAD